MYFTFTFVFTKRIRNNIVQFFTVIHARKLTSVGYVERIRVKPSAFRIVVGKPQGMNRVVDISVGVRIMCLVCLVEARLGNVLTLEYCVVITQILCSKVTTLHEHLCLCPLSNRHRRVESTSHNLTFRHRASSI